MQRCFDAMFAASNRWLRRFQALEPLFSLHQSPQLSAVTGVVMYVRVLYVRASTAQAAGGVALIVPGVRGKPPDGPRPPGPS